MIEQPDGGLWGEAVARRYDDSHADMFDASVLDPTVEVLAELAGTGRALEFAIGTGRVALPLSERGVDVSGIELSPSMLSEFRQRPGAERIEAVEGDMATTRVDGEFSVVYLVFNTITNLLSQDEQVACFENAAAHLAPGGHFVIETFVPRLQELPPGERFVAFHAGDYHAGIDDYDVVTQRLTSVHYHVDRGVVFHSPHRYAWPAEYDLMARIAGLELHTRWADWERHEFTAESPSHVSVWSKPA